MKLVFNSREEFEQFIQEEVLSTSQAEEYLGVSRQFINDLVKRGKLAPIKEINRIKLFLKSDLDQRKKEADALRKKYRPYDD